MSSIAAILLQQRVLPHNFWLESLHLEDNDITEYGARAIANGMRVHWSQYSIMAPQTLNLRFAESWCLHSRLFFVHFAGLSKNSTLELVSLAQNKIRENEKMSLREDSVRFIVGCREKVILMATFYSNHDPVSALGWLSELMI